MKSCYIHIPFCNNICSYCDFCKLYYNKTFVDKYLKELDNEITMNYKGEKLDTIYIGGGTPSSLSYSELETLLKIVEKLNVSEELEYTIEANFDSIDEEKLNLLKKYGVNRISFGLETTNNKLLKLLNRTLDKKGVINIINYCKKIGITNINVDLMYALPNETIEDLKEDIKFLKQLDIPHISTYALMIEEHTKLYINNIKNIEEEKDAEMYAFICNELKDYNHYEISNFAKPGYESKHNKCYWHNLEYYGFGLGASGYIKERRYTNTKSINKYIAGKHIKELDSINFYDKIDYEIILNLRLKEGINKKTFYNKYNKTIEELYDYKILVKTGLLIEDKNNIYIPEDKWYISNEILVKFLEGGKYEEN